MKRLLLACFLLCAGHAHAQKPDPVLTNMLAPLVRDFRGQAGVYVRHLRTGQEVFINADTVFPTASMIKIPISVGMFARIEKGEIDYRKTLIFKDSLRYGDGEDIVAALRDGTEISLSKVMMLMITTSDNTASLWCQALAGGGAAINEWLTRNGMVHTRVNSRTPGREGDWKKYGWGQTTPREMANLMVRIREGSVVSRRASERLYRNLCRIYWDSEALSQIPPYIQVASKSGAVDASKSEVVLVNAPHGDYVFCVITKNQEDRRWVADNEGYVLLRKVSRLLWKYFESDYQWEPPAGAEKWY